MRSRSSKKTTRNYSRPGKRKDEKRAKDLAPAVWYEIPYPASAYTFPQEALIKTARFDKNYVHIELTDGRILSIPLQWIPTLFNAPSRERKKFEISQDRTMIIWDPDKCTINDELRVADYLGPCRKVET